MRKVQKVKKKLGAVRKVQIMQGAFDGRYVSKEFEDKKKKMKNGYRKYKKVSEE